MKNIQYVCYKYEDSLGYRRAIEIKGFKKVEDAIKFVSDKKDERFSWWEIKVEWGTVEYT